MTDNEKTEKNMKLKFPVPHDGFKSFCDQMAESRWCVDISCENCFCHHAKKILTKRRKIDNLRMNNLIVVSLDDQDKI